MMRRPWKSSSPRVPLIFPGRRPAAVSFRLFFLVILSLALHVAAFYVFEVAYPESRKELAKEAGMLLLRANDPEAQAVLARHEERLRVFSGFDHPPPHTLPRIGMRLGFENHEPRLMPMILDPPEADPGIFTFRPFPPVASASPGNPSPAPGQIPNEETVGKPVARIEWSAAGQTFAEARERKGDIPQTGLRSVWHAAIDSDGIVRHLILLDGDASATGIGLRQLLLGGAAPPGLPRPDEGAMEWVRLVVVF